MNFDVTSNLTSEQKDAFKELKQQICAEFGQEFAEDFRIYRFLKARDFDVRQAEIMLRNHFEWRKKEKIDTMLQDYKAPEVLEKYYPMNMLGFDNDGCPIMIFEFGNTDFKGLLKSITREEILRHMVFFLECGEKFLREQTAKLGRPIQTWIAVLDFENSTLSQVTNKACIDFVLDLSDCYDSNYPERLKVEFTINASIYFNFIFNILKSVLSAVTLQKMKSFGKEGWKEELVRIMDPDELPAYLGGNRTDPDGDPRCSATMVHGGAVPKRYFFKSSERRLSSKPGVIKYDVKRTGKVQIPIEVQIPGSFLEWEFETENYDVGFGLHFKKTGQSSNEKPRQLIPVQRVDTHMQSEIGTYMCSESGIYILTLDNSHSWFRQKQIYCRTNVIRPEKEQNTSLK